MGAEGVGAAGEFVVIDAHEKTGDAEDRGLLVVRGSN